MDIGFANPVMLGGLAAVLIPLLIHLFSRRRRQVVDWAAMQFLDFARPLRRRLLLEETALLALRMGLIALLVLALAAPYAATSWLGKPVARDVMLILDGSSSMAMADGKAGTPFAIAKEKMRACLDTLNAGDRVGLLLARHPPEALVGELSEDFDYVRDKLDEVPSGRANPDWPRTLELAKQILRDQGKNTAQEIILFKDTQRFGWADPDSLAKWEGLAPRSLGGAEKSQAISVRVVDVTGATDASQAFPHYTLAPLKTSRMLACVAQTLKFTGALRLEGPTQWIAPRRLYFEVDGAYTGEIDLPPSSSVSSGVVPFSFSWSFSQPGGHLVSVIVEPDLPVGKRQSDHQIRDVLPLDNRQDLAIQVIRSLPVLLIDGNSRLSTESSTFFLNKALAGPSDSNVTTAVSARTVVASDWTPAMLEDSWELPRPRAVILADVTDLTAPQSVALEKYVAEGGGVLIVLGPRLSKDKSTYLSRRQGNEWLATRLDKVAGAVSKPELAVSPDAQRLQHPALEIFQQGVRSLAQAHFLRWWQVITDPAHATVAAALTNGDPLLVEQRYKMGRVLVCTVPLDRSWGATFPSLWDYPVFVHELVYYLADARGAMWNLEPGQPMRVSAEAVADEAGRLPERLLFLPPDGRPNSVKVDTWPWVFQHTGAVGPYRLRGDQGRVQYFVVHGDSRESDLTPCTQEGLEKVARWLPVSYGLATHHQAEEDKHPREDLWWLLLVGVTFLLCGEVWWTRRLARRRAI